MPTPRESIYWRDPIDIIMAMTDDELNAINEFIKVHGTNHVAGVIEGILLQRKKDEDANAS